MEKKDGYINVSEILKAVLSKKKLFLIFYTFLIDDTL